MTRTLLALVTLAGCTTTKQTTVIIGGTTTTTTTTAPDATGHWLSQCDPMVDEEGYTLDVVFDLELVDTDGVLTGTGSYSQTGTLDTGEVFTSDPFSIEGTRDGDQIGWSLVFDYTGAYDSSFVGTLAGNTIEADLTIASYYGIEGHCTFSR